MKPEEIIAKKYLEQHESGIIIHEPDGKIPPDFSLNSIIGIEVRRLNKNIFINNTYEDLDINTRGLYLAIDEVLKSLDSQFSGKSYYVNYTLKRPFRRIFDIKRDLKRQLQDFLDQAVNPPVTLHIPNNLEIEIVSRTPVSGRTFRFGGGMDDDEDSGVIHSYFTNINLCISEKNKKIEKYKARYQEWWLVLVDKVQSYPDKADLDEIDKHIIDLGNFNRLCIINPVTLDLMFDKKK
ncbi:MAG: hypothetical protein ACYDGL_13155 [Bellilinea sp.]